MSDPPNIQTGHKAPTRRQAAAFRAKTFLFQLKRGFENAFRSGIDVYGKNNTLQNEPVIAESKTRLWTETEPEERVLVAGKIQNLRLALARVDGIVVPGGEVFSFWKQVGRTSRDRGFVAGREIREGCVIPNVGGGLCQLSNSLYDAALKANFEIIERHAHTQIVPGSLAEEGRDATVFWNYVDLRFRARDAFRIEAKMDGEHLRLKFRAAIPSAGTFHQISRNGQNTRHPNSCASCEVNDCFRVIAPSGDKDFGRTAFLVDEFSPEFDEYIQSRRTDKDRLSIPLDGRRFRKANYGWNTTGFAKWHQSLFATAERSYRSRRLAAQGASRQLNLLLMYEKLAASYAKKLRFDELHVVVHQNLLPFLWRDGHLGGRTFDVLMTALPMGNIEDRLDLAHSLHPESKTLGDFRARPGLVRAESDALRNARKIITPHTEIASIFGERAHLLNWSMPADRPVMRRQNAKPRIVFASSTVGRKGCYELREALYSMDVTLVTLGGSLEGNDFWEGFDVVQGGADWLENADLVVLPAFVEHRPRRLLRAAAAGVRVVASYACGLQNVAGVDSVDAGDAEMLRTAIVRNLTAPSQG